MNEKTPNLIDFLLEVGDTVRVKDLVDPLGSPQIYNRGMGKLVGETCTVTDILPPTGRIPRRVFTDRGFVFYTHNLEWVSSGVKHGST